MNALDPDLSDFEARQIWRGLPVEGEGSQAELLFIASRQAAVESKKTNGKLRDHNQRISRVERVYAAIILAGPVVFFILGKIWD